jgi:hypothetical protein
MFCQVQYGLYLLAGRRDAQVAQDVAASFD